MTKLKITTEIVDLIPKSGIINSDTLENILHHNYFFIKTIYNYNDLTYSNFEIIYLLYESQEDFKNENCKFCRITHQEIKISKNKYTKLNFFYKEKTICVLERLYYIIDLNENIIEGPHEDIWEIQPKLEECYREIIRCSEEIEKNYSFIKRKTAEEKVYFSLDPFPVFIEEDLGYYSDSTPITSNVFSFLDNYNQSGICIFKDDEKFGFINKYFAIIAYGFDHVYTNEELLQIGIINKDGLVQYVQKETKLMKIKFVGNYVEEITKAPNLF